MSICYGGGFLEDGIEQTGVQLKHVLILEKEAFACGNVVKKMEASHVASCPIFTDITSFDARPFRKKVHSIIGGYPCTPFSVAGEMQGVESDQFLWPYIFKIICTVRPLQCFFENVPNHYKDGYDQVVTDLESAGYAVESGFYSAREAGGYIERKRFFIYGLARPYREVLRRKFRSLQKKERRQRHTFLQQDEIRNSSTNVPIAPIGELEYDHEYDRIITSSEIESILGLSADGSNYREYFIQLLGNGVHPPTAKLAFTELFKKQMTCNTLN